MHDARKHDKNAGLTIILFFSFLSQEKEINR
jgi:hypothetical protein